MSRGPPCGRLSHLAAFLCVVVLGGSATVPVRAEDWPEWRGKGRLGVWTGIVDTFPANGLRATWRTPIGSGYAGPAVAGGRVFVTDSRRTKGNRAIERVLALDEITGRVLWTQEWETDYTGCS